MEHRFVSTNNSLVIGADAFVHETAPDATGVAIGPQAVLAGDQGVAVGAAAEAGAGGVAVGDHAETTGESAVAIGDSAGASAVHQIAIGAGVGLGNDSPGAIAIGTLADAKANGIAIGRSVSAGLNEVVIGRADTVARFGGDFALPTVAMPPTDPPADPTKAVIRFCTANGAVYVWAGTAWSVIG